MKFVIVVSLVVLHNQMATPQVVRPPPYNFMNRPIGEKMVDTGNFINQLPSTVISEPPCDTVLPNPSVVGGNEPRTTLITDCSPEICQNLANTIQLMIVSNLLQNTQTSHIGRQFANPIVKEILSSPILSCSCNNAFSPNVITPNVYTPNVITPNIADPHFPPNVITNYIPANIVDPNSYPPNFIPNLVSPTPNIISPTPNMISPNIISPNMIPLPPRVVTPTVLCPNSPQAGPTNVNGLLSAIMSMLGNIQG